MVIKHPGSCFDISPFIVADSDIYATVYIELVLNDLTLSDGFVRYSGNHLLLHFTLERNCRSNTPFTNSF